MGSFFYEPMEKRKTLCRSLPWCVSHPAYFSNYVLQLARLLEENYFLPDPLKSIWNIFQKVYKTILVWSYTKRGVLP